MSTTIQSLGKLALGLAAALLSLSLQAEVRTLGVTPATSKEARLALVIGNAGYADAPLSNPANDARDLGQTLKKLGFKVTTHVNLDEKGMKKAIRNFGDELARSGGVGLFYFAGHGVQVRGKNYLLPIAAQIQKESDVEIEGVEADWVLSQMEEARNRLNMVILDACRNNPLPRSVRSANRGLAPMNAPAGTLVAFATAPGTVASDGTGRNGLYTRHLMAQMTRPGLTIEQVFKRVRESVRKESGGIQVPEELNKLVGEDFYLVAASAPAAPADAGIRPDDEIVLWEAIKDGSRREDFEEYLRQYPNGRFVALANSRLKSAQPGRTKPADAGLAPSAPGINQVAMKTSQGTIVLELYPDKAPKTVANFLDYVKTGHYQGTVFHRVINNFMIQGGGYDPQLRQLPTRPPIENESGNGLKNEAFTIAMARTANPHSATAQFFINLKDNAFLNHAPPQQWGYTVFGRVVLGRDVVERIGRLPTGGRGPFPTDVPRQDVVIEGVTTGPTN